MSETLLTTRVAIIGGGPAGSSLAIFLRARGIDCLILEQEKFPRFHVGESLLPENMVMFERLGIADAVRAAGFIEKPGATFIYDSPPGEKPTPPATIRFKNALFSSPPAAINVRRAEFDNLLLRQAERRGAVVREEVTVLDVTRDPGGRVTGLNARDKAGAEFSVQADLVADCSGQAAFLGKKMGVWRDDARGHARAAFFCHFKDVVREPAPEEGNIVLVFGPERWTWIIPLADGNTSVGVVVSKQLLNEKWAGDNEKFQDEILRSSAGTMARLKNATRTAPVRSIQNYSYDCSTYSGEGWLLVGDSATFLDPIYSTGLSFAMRGAESAAAAIAGGVARNEPLGPRHFAEYEKQIRTVLNCFKPYIYGWYDPVYQRTFKDPKRIGLLMPAMTTLLAGDMFSPWKRFWVKCWTPFFWLGVWAERIFGDKRKAA